MSRPVRFLRRTLQLGIVLGCAVLGARTLSRHFVFPVHRVAQVAPPASATPWTFMARDGVVVHALELPGPKGAPVVVHFHNNRETAAHAALLSEPLQRRGLGVLLVEYRGYGPHTNEAPTEEGVYADAEAALDALGARGVFPDRIVLWGTSLGTGVATEMARRGRGSALVLVSPYTSIPDLATDVVPIFPSRLLIRERFDNLAKGPSIHMPTLVIHGDADEVVPYWMGERLSHTIDGARLLRVSGGRHGDLFLRDGDRLLSAIASIANLPG